MPPVDLPTDPTLRPERALVWLSGALGDTILGFPALAALRAWAPSATITAAGRPSYLALAARAGIVDDVLDADGPLGTALFSGAGDLPIPTPGLAIAWSAAYSLLADRLVAMGVRSIIAAPPRPDDPRHQARYLLDCLLPLGVPRALRAAPSPRVGPPPAFLAGLLRHGPGPVALLHPGAGARWKRWPLDRMLALAAGIAASGVTVQWSCGPADADLRAALADNGIAPWPEMDLPLFASCLASCSLLVSPDTGVAHLAALLDVPQVVLFCPTDPRRWRPIGRQAAVLAAPNLCGGDWPIVSLDAPDGPPPSSATWHSGSPGSGRGPSAAGAVPGTPPAPSMGMARSPTDVPARRDPLRRCHPREAAEHCRCLAALPLETVLASCLQRLAGPGSRRAPGPRPRPAPH